MKRRLPYFVVGLIGLLTALLISSVVLQLLPLGTTAAAACRAVMTYTEGYGPWQERGPRNTSGTATQVILDYWDGYNTAGCQARAIGPLWIAAKIDETMVGCSLGLDKGMCPRARYGVVP